MGTRHWPEDADDEVERLENMIEQLHSTVAEQAERIKQLEAAVERNYFGLACIEYRQRIAQLEEQLAASQLEAKRLREALDAVQQVAYRSDGIAGWHLNGDIASWDLILPEVEEALSHPASTDELEHYVAERITNLEEELLRRNCETCAGKNIGEAATRITQLEDTLYTVKPVLIAWSSRYESSVTEEAIAKINEVLK